MAKVMNASDFVKKAKDIANNYKTLYVMGCFGSPMNATNKKRYCNNNAYNKQPSRQKMINNATSDTFGFDCVCLLKGIFWGWNGNKNATYGGAKYASNGVPDVNANQMYKSYCTNQSTNFKKIEVGEFLWMEGHIGVYIGNGLAVECTPAWKNKVQITAVSNIAKKSGYNNRKWTGHGKSIFLNYDVKETNQTPSNSSSNVPNSSKTTKYYKKYTGKSNSLVDALKSLKIDSSFSYRRKIAKANGIKLYLGTANQNLKLLNLLKQGKLVKP
jgi:hypothetical protein